MKKTEKDETLTKDNEQIGKNVRKIRMEKQLLQKDLAQKLNVSINTISALERGKPDISLSRLLQLCYMLNVSLFDLLADTSIVKIKVPTDFIHSYAQLNDNNKELIDTNLRTMIKQQRVSKDNEYFKNNEKIEYTDIYDMPQYKASNNNQSEFEEEFQYDELDDEEFEREKYLNKFKDGYNYEDMY